MVAENVVIEIISSGEELPDIINAAVNEWVNNSYQEEWFKTWGQGAVADAAGEHNASFLQGVKRPSSTGRDDSYSTGDRYQQPYEDKKRKSWGGKGTESYGGSSASGSKRKIPEEDHHNTDSLAAAMSHEWRTAETTMGVEVTLDENDVACVETVIREIQDRSGTQLQVTPDPNNKRSRKMSITGPPMGVYLAHFMAMSRVVDQHDQLEQNWGNQSESWNQASDSWNQKSDSWNQKQESWNKSDWGSQSKKKSPGKWGGYKEPTPQKAADQGVSTDVLDQIAGDPAALQKLLELAMAKQK